MSYATIFRHQGDTLPLVFNFRRGESPYDLTGSTVELSVSATIPAGANPVYSMNQTLIEGSKVSFVPISSIANLAPGNYFGQIQVTDSNNYSWTAYQFILTVKPII